MFSMSNWAPNWCGESRTFVVRSICPKLVHKTHCVAVLSCFRSSLFVILVQLAAKNAAVDGTIDGWVDSKKHPIGIKSAFIGTEQIF